MVKTHYLPPVIEKNARKGYSAPSVETMYATIALHAVSLMKIKGFFVRKPVEKLESILAIHYPIDLVCVGEKCMLKDPVADQLIMDHGVIGSLAFLLQHPEKHPYIEPYIVIEKQYSSFSEDQYVEEYSVPYMKTGPGRYYIPFIAYLIVNKRERVLIEPPIYYLTGFPVKKATVRVFESLRSIVRNMENEVPVEKLIDLLKKNRDYMRRPETRKSIETGLSKLYELGVIAPGDAVYVNNILR